MRINDLIKLIKKDMKETAKTEWQANKSILRTDYKIKSCKEWLESALTLDIESYDEYQAINWTAGYLYGLQQALRFIEQLKVKENKNENL